MRAVRSLTAVVAFASFGVNAGDVAEPATPAKSATFAEAWRALNGTHNGCSAKDLHFDYWPDGGIRNFYCHVISRFSYATVLKLAKVKPFLRGPHGQHGAQTRLALHDPRDFGRYNPEFVRFLVDNAIPAASDAALRAETQPVYDQFVQQLARVYFVVHERLVNNPAGMKRARDEYMRVMDEKKPDWAGYYDKYSTFLGEADTDWGGYDPNLQSAAVAWWLRRDVDKTAPIWFEGLTKLLRTYDGAWLESQQTQRGTKN